MQSHSSSYYPSAICSDGIAVDCIRIVGLIQGCQDTVIGLYITRLLQDQVIYTCFQFIYPFALFLLPQMLQDCITIIAIDLQTMQACRSYEFIGPVNYGRVNLACGTIGTEQRGYKVVVYRAVPKIFVMKPLI